MKCRGLRIAATLRARTYACTFLCSTSSVVGAARRHHVGLSPMSAYLLTPQMQVAELPSVIRPLRDRTGPAWRLKLSTLPSFRTTAPRSRKFYRLSIRHTGIVGPRVPLPYPSSCLPVERARPRPCVHIVYNSCKLQSDSVHARWLLIVSGRAAGGSRLRIHVQNSSPCTETTTARKILTRQCHHTAPWRAVIPTRRVP